MPDKTGQKNEMAIVAEDLGKLRSKGIPACPSLAEELLTSDSGPERRS